MVDVAALNEAKGTLSGLGYDVGASNVLDKTFFESVQKGLADLGRMLDLKPHEIPATYNSQFGAMLLDRINNPSRTGKVKLDSAREALTAYANNQSLDVTGDFRPKILTPPE